MSLSTTLTKIVTTATTIAREVNDNTALRDLLCGSYEDGRVRNVVDAAKGEYKSPKQKRKEEKGKKHKKHKKDKYKKKYKKLKNKTKKHNKKQKKYAKKYKYTI